MALITSFSDGELHDLEDVAETMMREALDRVMDVLARRIERHDPRAALTAAAGPCTFCLSPRHPGPCAKPGADLEGEGAGHGPARKGGGGNAKVPGGPAGEPGPGGRPHAAGAHRTGGDTEVRPTLRDAQDTDDIERATKDEIFKISGQHTRVDFAGADPQIAREHSEGILRGLERHPDTKLDEIGMARSLPGGASAHAVPKVHPDGTISHSIHFSATETNDPGYRAGLLDEYQRGFATGAHPGGVGSHEFGHAVHQQSSGYRVSGGASQAAAEKYGGRRWRQAADLQISEYAGTDTEELSAEAFCDVIQNGAGASNMSRDVYAAIGGTP